MRQIGLGFNLYQGDFDERLPDRRDIKRELRGSETWAWPASDPRAGWAVRVISPYIRSVQVFICPSIQKTTLGSAAQVLQSTEFGPTNYWLWRFDHMDADKVELDNLWGKTEGEAVADLHQANNPTVGEPTGPAEVELVVDPYMPRTIGSLPANLKGLAAHTGGRNRLMLDLHAKWMRDTRTNP